MRRFVAPDDYGHTDNPMIVQGQIRGGLTRAPGSAPCEEIPYDNDGNHLAASFIDHLAPTAVNTPTCGTAHAPTQRQRPSRAKAWGHHRFPKGD